MKKYTRRDFLRFSSVAAAGALAAACAKTAEPEVVPTDTPKADEPTATTKPDEPTATPSPEPVLAWPREDVPRNRTYIQLFQGGGGEYGDTGIAGPWASGFCHQCGHAAEMEALAYFSAHGNTMYPWLAEGWEYNDEATELTVNIRKGVEWSDGVPFTSKDVEFTINTLIEKAPDLRDSTAIALWVKSIEAIDDYTVKFTFNEPTWRFMINWMTFRFDRGVYLVPAHIYEEVEGDYREFTFYDPEKGWPVVTAPYQIVEDIPTHKHFDLRYDWWASKTGFAEDPKPERIIMLPFSDHTIAAEMLINGEIDQGPEFPPATIESIVAQAPHIITHTGRESPYGYVDWWPLSMYFNSLEEPYDDVKVRWAMALAIDQQQLVDFGQKGHGMVTNVPFPFYPPLMKYIDGIQDLLEEYDPLAVDLDRSADLMIEAGFTKDGEGFWVDADGNRPDARIYASTTFFSDIGPITAEQLRNAGFDATHLSPPDVWSIKADGSGLLHMFGHGGSIIDEMAVTPVDDPKMMDLFRAAMEIFLREMVEVPLIQYFHRIGYNTTYWTNWPTEDNPYINGAQRHLTFPILLWNIQPAQ
jgi:peptide/nickel transport system substrate-binding protein